MDFSQWKTRFKTLTMNNNSKNYHNNNRNNYHNNNHNHIHIHNNNNHHDSFSAPSERSQSSLLDQPIKNTADDAMVAKLATTHAGYYSDPFLDAFCRSPEDDGPGGSGRWTGASRSGGVSMPNGRRRIVQPLIKRGTHARVCVMDRVVSVFLKKQLRKVESESETESKTETEGETGTGTGTGTETATNTAASQPVETDARPRTRRNTSSSNLDPSDETTKSRKDNRSRHSSGDGSEKTNSTGFSTDNPNSNNTSTSSRSYSISELIKSLGAVEEGGAGVSNLPQSLERRVQDFRFAQQKRREKHGDQKPWGIYGLYAHLSDIRADLEWAEDAAWRRRRNEPYLSWKDFDSHRDQGLYSQPYFTYGIMVLCTILMVVTLGFNGWKFEPLTINPLIGPSSETLLSCGARDTNLIVNEGQWFRLFSPMILHAGLVHYLVNMLALYFIGGAVEKAHGLAFTAVLFVVPAVGGNILSAICLPGFISVGASGGIFGLIGGCMADICLNWNLLFLKTTTDDDTRTRHLCVLLWLAMDIIVNCLLGFTPFVDNFTHLGGFLYGFCIGFASIERLASGFFGIRNGDSFWSKLKSALLRYFGLVLSVVTILATTVVLARSDGVTSPCHGCRYISCVPFPFSTEDKWWHCDDCDIVTADLFMATDGSGLYQQVNIHCPDGEVEEIPIGAEGIYDREELRRFLPSYCRDYCSEVFANNP